MTTATTLAAVIGTGTVSLGATLQTIGWAARRFVAQQASNHQDTLKALDALEDIRKELPRYGWRITRLELTAICGVAGAALAIYNRKQTRE